MDDIEVGGFWNANAEAWAVLSRAGCDRSRDLFNTPQFLAILPEVARLAGLDIGCGEGHNARLLARRGARMTAIDIADKFMAYAIESEQSQPLGIRYMHASGQQLPFVDSSFDFATAFMSLMDMPRPELAVAEAYRVLRPGAFFQFSICHPCFQTPRWKWVSDETGRKSGVVCGDYFNRHDGDIDEWIFVAAPEELKQKYGKFRIPRFERTLSQWTNMLLDVGFAVTRFQEPTVDDETLAKYPGEYDARLIAWFLHIQCRKPK